MFYIFTRCLFFKKKKDKTSSASVICICYSVVFCNFLHTVTRKEAEKCHLSFINIFCLLKQKHIYPYPISWDRKSVLGTLSLHLKSNDRNAAIWILSIWEIMPKLLQHPAVSHVHLYWQSHCGNYSNLEIYFYFWLELV